MAGILGRVASDALGLSDIFKVVAPERADLDDFLMAENNERLYILLKSKSDDVGITQRGIIILDGKSSVSKKKNLKRYDFMYNRISNVELTTPDMIDLDMELKFTIGNERIEWSIDKGQVELVKDIYKSLIEIGQLQVQNQVRMEDSKVALATAKELLGGARIEITEPRQMTEILKSVTNFNLSWLEANRNNNRGDDFSEVFVKFIEN